MISFWILKDDQGAILYHDKILRNIIWSHIDWPGNIKWADNEYTRVYNKHLNMHLIISTTEIS